jgi:hypothetical protein
VSAIGMLAYLEVSYFKSYFATKTIFTPSIFKTSSLFLSWSLSSFQHLCFGHATILFFF